MNDKNRETTTIKQTFSYGKSKTVTVEVVEKRKRSKEKNVLNKKQVKFCIFIHKHL